MFLGDEMAGAGYRRAFLVVSVASVSFAAILIVIDLFEINTMLSSLWYATLGISAGGGYKSLYFSIPVLALIAYPCFSHRYRIIGYIYPAAVLFAASFLMAKIFLIIKAVVAGVSPVAFYESVMGEAYQGNSLYFNKYFYFGFCTFCMDTFCVA